MAPSGVRYDRHYASGKSDNPQQTKCIWDGHVQKDDDNQLDRTQDQQLE